MNRVVRDSGVGRVVGDVFGPYRIEGLLGRGGMGEVHRAFDTARQRVVALKRLPASLAAQPAFQARFRAESQLAARLSSAHVIPIHDYGEIDGQLFIDMRLVEGDDLGDRLQAGPLAPSAAVGVIEQVAVALDAAHRAELEHRDVKPSNILLSAREKAGGQEFVYLVDFGIARAVDNTSQGLTGTGELVGTLSYMAPERFLGARSDHRADIYSLAAVLAECLTGSKPFVTDGAAAAMYAHLHQPPPRPSLTRPGVPVALDVVIARGMAKNPADRYASAGEFAAAARAALTAPARTEPAHPYPPGYRPGGNGAPPAYAGGPPPEWAPSGGAPPHGRPAIPRPEPEQSRRRRWPLLAGGLALVVAVAVAGIVVVQNQDTPVAAAGARVVRVSGNLPVNAASGMAITSDGQSFFVTRPGTSTTGGSTWQVERHNAADGSLTSTIPLPAENSGGQVALSPDNATLAVAASADGATSSAPRRESVVLIDLASSAVAATIPVPERVSDLRYSPDSSRLYADATASLVVIDPARRAIDKTVSTGQSGLGSSVAVSPDGRSVFVSGSAGVKTVDPAAGTVTSTIGLRGDPAGMAITPDGRTALVVTAGENAVAVLDLTTGQALAAVPVGARPAQIALTADGTQAVVTNNDPGTVTVIDVAAATTAPSATRPAASAATTLSVGMSPDDVAFSADGAFALVVTSSNVVRLDRS